MIAKSHCKIAYETETEQEELEDFYDFSSAYEDVSDDGVAEALRRDADLDADPAAGMSAAEFRTAVAASRRQ
jgi:pre-60S factor REI1